MNEPIDMRGRVSRACGSFLLGDDCLADVVTKIEFRQTISRACSEATHANMRYAFLICGFASATHLAFIYRLLNELFHSSSEEVYLYS